MTSRFGEAALAADAEPIDQAYLHRQTGGDEALAREVMSLFREHARRHFSVIAGKGDARRRSDAAHTLKGAARAIGAWHVASVVQEVEAALETGNTARVEAVVADLANALAETDAAIARILARPA